MFYPQKKTYRPPYNKSRFCENEKWDSNIPPTITFEKKQTSSYTEDPPAKYRKHKRPDNENALSADPSNHRPPNEKRGYNYPAKRWGHDKYDESVSPHLFFSNRPNNKGPQRKPDRQLYCVREKQNSGNETIEYRKKSYKKEEQVVRPSSAKETAASTREDESQSQEDENSFISSLTSLLSQKEKDKGKEQEVKGSDHEFRDDAVIARGPIVDLLQSIHVTDPHVLFEMTLQNEKGTQNITVWDNEKSYEKFLNEVCEKHNIDGKMALYFKINLLKRIQDLQPNNREVDLLLNKLLDFNFRVMLCDIEQPEDKMTHFTRTLNLITG